MSIYFSFRSELSFSYSLTCSHYHSTIVEMMIVEEKKKLHFQLERKITDDEGRDGHVPNREDVEMCLL